MELDRLYLGEVSSSLIVFFGVDDLLLRGGEAISFLLVFFVSWLIVYHLNML